jgi:HD superfamily phosphodiesterase
MRAPGGGALQKAGEADGEQALGALPPFEAPVYERIFNAALPFLQTRQNEIHTRTCLRFALRLLDEEDGDAGVVVPAVVLHDVGWSRVPEHLQLSAFGPNVSRPELRDVHEREGAAIAREILAEIGYCAETSERIALIVSRHDSRPDAESLEEAIVKDADKLWRYSREGIAVDSDRFGATPAEHLALVAGFLEEWFLTRTGKRIARAEVAGRKEELGLR